MKTISSIAAELLGLFVEDSAFAAEIAGLLAAIIALNAYSIGSGNMRALLLILGLGVILLKNVARVRKR